MSTWKCLKLLMFVDLERVFVYFLGLFASSNWIWLSDGVVSGRSPSSIRIGSGSGVAVKDPVPGTSQQSNSPPTSRSFLGRFGIRKPSLLSLSSATSAVSVTASSPHQYENRTFSLDDLLRPTRSMMSKISLSVFTRNWGFHLLLSLNLV